ncbi:MAG: anti-sigma-K factor RskA [Planctomycetota bacterium]|jgi:anti-sigma-K factor RskA
MSQNNEQPMTRHEELIADSALFGLSIQEAEERRGLEEQIDGAEGHDLDFAAALLHEAFLSDDDMVEMPEKIRQSILLGSRFQVRPQDIAETAPQASELEKWWLPMGAAAAVLIAAIGVFAFSAAATPKVATEITSARFEKESRDLSTSSWETVNKGFAEVEGYVSWSAEEQFGYMHLKGLPRNVPTTEQYQLWIVDGDRDGAPVDGGVFNVDTNGEVVVAISAKLNVSNAKAFVITREVPGGVVVSKGPHLVLAAL